MEKGYFTKEIEIPFCDCDAKKCAKIASIMKYMADTAGLAYASKGYTHSWLWEHNFVFLLSKVSIHIERMPAANETVVLHTWEQMIKGALFYRNFVFYDQSNQKIIEAKTAWVLVNPTTRHIIRPSDFTGTSDLHPEKDVDTLAFGKIKLDNGTEQGTRKIVYSDIDGNRHVYNATYAAIACDFLPADLMEKPITDFRINFKHEALLGNCLTIKSNISGNKAVVVGYLQENISFECEFIFRENQQLCKNNRIIP